MRPNRPEPALLWSSGDFVDAIERNPTSDPPGYIDWARDDRIAAVGQDYCRERGKTAERIGVSETYGLRTLHMHCRAPAG
jgi:hypothetical protein